MQGPKPRGRIAELNLFEPSDTAERARLFSALERSRELSDRLFIHRPSPPAGSSPSSELRLEKHAHMDELEALREL